MRRKMILTNQSILSGDAVGKQTFAAVILYMYQTAGSGFKNISRVFKYIISRLVAQKAACHLVISILNSAEITAEAVFIQLLSGLYIPEAAGIGADFIRQHNLTI